MKRTALIVVALIVAMIAAINIAAYFIDERAVAASLAAAVKAKTGREFEFGEVRVRLLPRPALVLSAVRFGNAPWGSQPWLARCDRVTADLDLGPLLSGRVRIRHIALYDASVLLETDSNGNGNWVVDSTSATPEWLKSLEIDEVSLQRVAFTYRNGVSGNTVAVSLDDAQIELPSTSHPIRLDARATIDGQRVDVRGSIGALTTLLANGPDYPVNLVFSIGAMHAKVNGDIGQPLTMNGIDLQLVVEAGDWWRPAADGVRLPPFHASARMSDAPHGYQVNDLQLKIRDSDASASLLVALGGPRPRVTGSVSSASFDLGQVTPPAGDDRAPVVAAAGAAAPASSRAAGAWKLADVDLELTIGRLKFADGRQVRAGSGRLVLDDGRLSTSGLQFTLGGAKVTLAGSVADPEHLSGIDLGVAVKGNEFSELLQFLGTGAVPAATMLGPYRGRAQLLGSHNALRMTAIDATIGTPGQNLHASGQIDDVLKRRGLALALAATVSDSSAAGALLGIELPRLPVLRATATVGSDPQGYVFDDLRLAMGRTTLQGRLAVAAGAVRPHIVARLSGQRVDLSEIPVAAAKPGTQNPLLTVDIDADLSFDEVTLPDQRTLGPLSGKARLTAGTVELTTFMASVDGARVTLDGRINDPLTSSGLDLGFDARVAHGKGLTALTGMQLQQLPAFKASGKLSGGTDGYAITAMTLASVAATFSGDIALKPGPKRMRVSVNGSSPLLDIPALRRAAASGMAAQAVTASTRAIPDMALPLDVLDNLDGDLDLRFDTVKFADTASLGPLHLRAEIADGRLEMRPVQLGIEGERMLYASLSVDAAAATWSLRVDGTGIDLGKLLTRAGHAGLVSGGNTDLVVQLRGAGKTLPVLIGSLDGDARLKIGSARVQNYGVSLGDGIFVRVFTHMNPFRKTDPDTEVSCLAARLPIKDGVVTSTRSVAIETTKYKAVLNGTLNLRTEAIDLAVLPIVSAGRGIGSGEITSVVRLRGTLSNPAMVVDPVGAAKSAASIGAAVATLGGWWLADAMLNQVISDPSPCATALAQ